VHEQKEFVIAKVIAAAIALAVASSGFARIASAQKDAAEKAREGGIEHWIEYYKGEQRKPAAPASPQPAAPPASQAAPGASTQDKTNR
jgi:hypothetical protein